METQPSSQVRILGNQYLVTIDGHSHVVGKDRRCHTCNDGGGKVHRTCTAVNEAARYLKTGGQRAPESVPTRARAPDPLPPCPICGAAVAVDHVLDHLKDGPGWRLCPPLPAPLRPSQSVVLRRRQAAARHVPARRTTCRAAPPAGTQHHPF